MMKVEEGRIIRENPLRILGVFSDTPKKEIVANLGKLRAYVKTGKPINFDSDFMSLLGPVNRTSESIEKANNNVSLPKDKFQAGMFWFMQHTDNDKEALECLKAGDADKAMAIFQRKGNYSGAVNTAVLALVLKRWDIALNSYAFLLESTTRRKALVKAFTDVEDYFSEDEIVEYISSKLIQDFPSVHWIEQLNQDKLEQDDKTLPFKSKFEDSKLFNKITSECILSIKKEIDERIKEAELVSKYDANANFSMAASLEDNCKPLLRELKIALGRENNTYIEYADDVANHILDNCINYYNHDVDNPKRAQNVIKYTRFAFRIAESKIAKERAKKSLDFLNDELEYQNPDTIEEEYNAIDMLVLDYKEKSEIDDFSFILGPIIDEAFQRLSSIKDKLSGEAYYYYLSFSSKFVNFALQEIMKKLRQDENFKTDAERQDFISSLRWAKSLFASLAKFNRDRGCQSNYIRNYAIFLALERKYNINQNAPKSHTVKPSINYHSTSSNSQSSSGYRRVYSRDTTSQSNNESSEDNSKFYLILFSFCIFVAFLILINAGKSCSSDNVSNPDSNSTLNEVVTTPSQSNYHSNSEKVPEESYSTIQYYTGDKPYQSTYGNGSYDKDTENSLLIKNGGSTDAVVFLERTNGKKVRHVFIRRGENFTMTSIPGGQYIIKVMEGTDWNPEKDNGEGNPQGGFMRSCSITKSERYDPFDYPYPSSGQYGQYEVTLYKVENGNMHTETINENELF